MRAVKILLESRANPNTYLKLIDAHNRTYNSSALQKAFLNSKFSYNFQICINIKIITDFKSKQIIKFLILLLTGHESAEIVELLIEYGVDVCV